MKYSGKALLYQTTVTPFVKWGVDFIANIPPAHGGVLIKVISAGLNPVDYKMPHLPHLWSARKGTVAGMDFCGTILAVGPGVEGFAVNDVVFGRGYGLAEYATGRIHANGLGDRIMDRRQAQKKRRLRRIDDPSNC